MKKKKKPNKNLGPLDFLFALLAALFAFDGSQAHGGTGVWSCGAGLGLDRPCGSLLSCHNLWFCGCVIYTAYAPFIKMAAPMVRIIFFYYVSMTVKLDSIFNNRGVSQ